MLATYQARLQALIQAPNSPTSLVPTATQTSYINTARNQLAADAECIRTFATLAITGATRQYLFSTITVPGGAGYGSVITLRSANLAGANLEFRPYEWFSAYYYGSPTTGAPKLASQQGQGVAGTVWLWPFPDTTYTMNLDVCVLPIPLVNDSTVEAIPDLWRDAVPFYAAWLAMQSLQRQADAEAMLHRYMMLARRGRQFATPTELPDNMPGGLGAQIAASRTTLGQPPAQAAGR